MSNGFERPQWRGDLSGGFWPTADRRHSTPTVSFPQRNGRSSEELDTRSRRAAYGWLAQVNVGFGEEYWPSIFERLPSYARLHPVTAPTLKPPSRFAPSASAFFFPAKSSIARPRQSMWL